MADEDENLTDPNKAVDFMIRHSKAYAQAKADRIYCEEYRKSLKAQLMKENLIEYNAVNAQEREAYADERYVAHLEGLKDAVKREEELRWMLIAAEARIEVWRSLEASKRSEIKMTV